MLAFFIVIAIIIIMALIVLFGKISIEISFKEEFLFSLKFFRITLYSSNNDKKSKSEKTPPETEKKANKKQNLLKRMIKKKGFYNSIKEILDFAKSLIKQARKFIKHFNIRRIFLDISVATDNAANTAILYGEICALVYPFLELISSTMRADFKKVDIKSDFEKQSPKVEFSFAISCPLIYILMLSFGIYKEYKNFVLRNDI